jgi:hypothetical protein
LFRQQVCIVALLRIRQVEMAVHLGVIGTGEPGAVVRGAGGEGRE